MEKETKYGIIADVHDLPQNVPLALNALKKSGVDKLIVNGDIGGNYGSLKDSQQYTSFILDQIGKSGLESFVQPGSHETLFGYGAPVEYFSEKYDNLFEIQGPTQIKHNGHQLIFIPGSDFVAEGEYRISSKDIPSGRFMDSGEGLVPFQTLNQYAQALGQGFKVPAFQNSNINDIRKFVEDSEKTIVVCHVPRKFDNLETCVDMAEFGEVGKRFGVSVVSYENGEKQYRLHGEGYSGENTILKRSDVADISAVGKMEAKSVMPLDVAEFYKDLGAPIEIKKSNRGNEPLRDLYEELGIRKSVTAHFHESSHRANDRNSKSVQEGQYVDELFWNSGCLDQGQFGILTVKGEKLKYENLRL